MKDRNKLTRRALSALVVCAALAWSAAAWATQPGSSSEPKRSYGAIDVTLYETSWCPYCKKARAFLKKEGVSLTEYDIEKDPKKRAEMIAKTGSRLVPVVDVEGIIIPGYSVEAMREAIEKKRRE